MSCQRSISQNPPTYHLLITSIHLYTISYLTFLPFSLVSSTPPSISYFSSLSFFSYSFTLSLHPSFLSLPFPPLSPPTHTHPITYQIPLSGPGSTRCMWIGRSVRTVLPTVPCRYNTVFCSAQCSVEHSVLFSTVFCSAQYSVLCMYSILLCSLCSVFCFCTICSLLYALHSPLFYVLQSVFYAVCSLLCILYCTLCSVLYTMFCTLHYVLYCTLYCTLFSILCALQSVE